MSVNHASMTTHAPQSLPSFAQAFSNQLLNTIPSANSALPPIHAHISPMDRDKARLQQRSPPTRSLSRPSSEENIPRTAGRKRPHNDIVSRSREDDRSESDGASPAAVRVKEENDQDMMGPTPSPPARPADQRPPPQDNTMLGAPTPSSTMPSPAPGKKRRMTITGAPHALNTDVRVPPDQTNSTPISPVVMGFTIPRDNPREVEQVKSMMSMKQKQKALIEQRRGSHAGPGVGDAAPQIALDERQLPATKAIASASSVSIRNTRRSPNGGAGARRPIASTSQRPASPNSSMSQMQPAQAAPHQSAHTLPPPPISFARRRAAQLGKKKPADIMISPREHQSTEQFQPSIHSAPPTQGAFYSGRHTMALPRLPNIMNSGGGEPVRRHAANVPPTPTRFSQRMAASAIPPSITISESTPRSPMASVPIASSLVPPTPAFHQNEFNGDRAAFLAPFNYFYDALNDAKQLKTWLSEQLQRSSALARNLSQMETKVNDMVEALVEKKMRTMNEDMTVLRRRVLELEEALEGRGRSNNESSSAYHSKGLQNGYGSSGMLAPDSYQFPPPEQSRLRSDLSSGRVPSPRGGGSQPQGDSEFENSSGQYDTRRPSVSASRLEPPRTHGHDPSPLAPPHSRISMMMQSPPPQSYHEGSSSTLHGKSSRPGDRDAQRPVPSRHASYSGGTQERDPRDWDRDRERRGDSPPPPRRSDSRRNSIIMSPPDHRMEEA